MSLIKLCASQPNLHFNHRLHLTLKTNACRCDCGCATKPNDALIGLLCDVIGMDIDAAPHHSNSKSSGFSKVDMEVFG